MRPLRHRVFLVALAVGLAGCGENSDQRAARATIDHFYAALKAHDARAACDLVSPSMGREIAHVFAPGKSCVPALEHGFRTAQPHLFDSAPDVRSVLVKGDEAIATVQRAYQRRKVGLTRVGDHWQIRALPSFG